MAGFIANLKERGIDLVLRYTDTGRIYGATFVDHESTTAANGSRLGKEYSANAIEQWKNNIVTEQAVEPPTSNQERDTHSDTQTQHDTGNHHSPILIRLSRDIPMMIVLTQFRSWRSVQYGTGIQCRGRGVL